MFEGGNPYKNKDETGHFSEITGQHRWLMRNVDYISNSINEAYQQTINSIDPTLRFIGKGLYSVSLGVYETSARWFVNEMFWQGSKNSQIKLFGPQTQAEMDNQRISAILSVGGTLIGNYLSETKGIMQYYGAGDDVSSFMTGNGLLEHTYNFVKEMGSFVDRWLSLNPGKETELKSSLNENTKRRSGGGSSSSYYIGSVKVTPKKTSSYSNVRSYLGQN